VAVEAADAKELLRVRSDEMAFPPSHDAAAPHTIDGVKLSPKFVPTPAVAVVLTAPLASLPVVVLFQNPGEAPRWIMGIDVVCVRGVVTEGKLAPEVAVAPVELTPYCAEDKDCNTTSPDRYFPVGDKKDWQEGRRFGISVGRASGVWMQTSSSNTETSTAMVFPEPAAAAALTVTVVKRAMSTTVFPGNVSTTAGGGAVAVRRWPSKGGGKLLILVVLWLAAVAAAADVTVAGIAVVALPVLLSSDGGDMAEAERDNEGSSW
jgi:hypothetical protein